MIKITLTEELTISSETRPFLNFYFGHFKNCPLAYFVNVTLITDSHDGRIGHTSITCLPLKQVYFQFSRTVYYKTQPFQELSLFRTSHFKNWPLAYFVNITLIIDNHEGRIVHFKYNLVTFKLRLFFVFKDWLFQQLALTELDISRIS